MSAANNIIAFPDRARYQRLIEARAQELRNLLRDHNRTPVCAEATELLYDLARDLVGVEEDCQKRYFRND